MKRLLFLPFFFFAFSGCDPASDETGCSEDSDCRFGRECVRNVCVGEVDLVTPTNNGVTNNGYSNNGYYTNNGYSNNGYYTNNGYSNNGYYTNNQTVSVCHIGPDCSIDDACTQGICTPAEIADLLGQGGSPDDCSFFWERGTDAGGTAEYQCERRQDGNGFDCFCLVEGADGLIETGFRGDQNACDDYAQIEQDMNDYCGTRFRDTFAP